MYTQKKHLFLPGRMPVKYVTSRAVTKTLTTSKTRWRLVKSCSTQCDSTEAPTSDRWTSDSIPSSTIAAKPFAFARVMMSAALRCRATHIDCDRLHRVSAIYASTCEYRVVCAVALPTYDDDVPALSAGAITSYRSDRAIRAAPMDKNAPLEW